MCEILKTYKINIMTREKKTTKRQKIINPKKSDKI